MFERKSMEEIVNTMIRWTRGTTTRITDFRVGSKARTLYESVGVVLEELYDKVYRSLKALIEDNIYAVIGFDKLPATYASGYARMSRREPAEENYIIPAGTVVLSRATQYLAPTKYRTIEDALLQIGHTYVDVMIVASVSGENGNAGVGDLNDFVQKPTGIEQVTNLTAIQGGQPEESKEEQKARFQTFIEANARGVIQSIEYGARLATIQDSDGAVVERVKQAKALEYLPARRGEVDVYLWNGVGDASEDLIEQARKIVYGYYDEANVPVYGYKSGGIILFVYTAPIRYVTLKIVITPEAWSTHEATEALAEQEVDRYFENLRMGTEFVQTALESEIKFLEGVKDVKLYVSIDEGVNFTTENVVPLTYEVILPRKPIIYSEG